MFFYFYQILSNILGALNSFFLDLINLEPKIMLTKKIASVHLYFHSDSIDVDKFEFLCWLFIFYVDIYFSVWTKFYVNEFEYMYMCKKIICVEKCDLSCTKIISSHFQISALQLWKASLREITWNC